MASKAGERVPRRQLVVHTTVHRSSEISASRARTPAMSDAPSRRVKVKRMPALITIAGVGKALQRKSQALIHGKPTR